MPKIIINEEDLTALDNQKYANFSVVVPGFVSDQYKKYEKIFDENGIYECSSQEDFVKYVGIVDGAASVNQYGNQIAFELLGLGYTVLYKKLTKDISNPEAEEQTGVNTDALKNLDSIDWWLPLADKSAYDFRYVITGKLKDNIEANKKISQLASFINAKDSKELLDAEGSPSGLTGRGDCIALVDIDETVYEADKSLAAIMKAIKGEVEKLTTADRFTGIFTPAITYKLDYTKQQIAEKQITYTNKTFPASFHYLACAAKAARNNFAEWYAVAGFIRGISDYKIVGTSYKFGEAAINTLQPRVSEVSDIATAPKAVNVITKVKNNYYLWGNRTAEGLTTDGLKASHFLNIRQLCTTIKKQTYIACRQFTFDPNSDVLWLNLASTITPTLERMKADQGLTEYKLVKIPSKAKAELTAKIRIIPIEAVEDFDITLSLENALGTGESTSTISE